MLKKTYVPSRQEWRIDFEIPVNELPDIPVESITIAGAFNNWDPTATPMTWVASRKVWKGRVYLKPGQEVPFRYYINQAIWYNDWHADDYRPGAFGAENCIIRVPPKP